MMTAVVAQTSVCINPGMSSAADKSCEKRRLCVCSRIHQNNADRPVDLAKVRQFLDCAIQYADAIAIAVGLPPSSNADGTVKDDASGAGRRSGITPDFAAIEGVAEAAEAVIAASSGPGTGGRRREGSEGDTEPWRVSVAGLGGEIAAGDLGRSRRIWIMVVTPWGRFTPALNALLSFAARDGADMVLFQSLETIVGKDVVLGLETRLGPDDLVVGAALAGHAFRAGETLELTGVTTPWNTLAVWDVRKLSKLGFIGVADGLVPGVAAGVEEVTAIATCQALFGLDHARAKLVRLPEVEWQTDWQDEARKRWHESKMSSKVERARAQMQALGIRSGSVEHVDAVPTAPVMESR